MIRTWCKDHPIQFMACYLVFYLAFFKLLEQGIQVPDLVLHCRLDDLIPFCKYAIIPYYLWFAWIPCTLFYLLWFNDRRELPAAVYRHDPLAAVLRNRTQWYRPASRLHLRQ